MTAPMPRGPAQHREPLGERCVVDHDPPVVDALRGLALAVDRRRSAAAARARSMRAMRAPPRAPSTSTAAQPGSRPITSLGVEHAPRASACGCCAPSLLARDPPGAPRARAGSRSARPSRARPGGGRSAPRGCRAPARAAARGRASRRSESSWVPSSRLNAGRARAAEQPHHLLGGDRRELVDHDERRHGLRPAARRPCSAGPARSPRRASARAAAGCRPRG